MLESIGFQWSLNAPENSIVIPTTGTANDVGLQKPVPPTDDTHWKMVEVSSNDDCKMDDGADTYDAPFDEPIVSSSQAENEDNGCKMDGQVSACDVSLYNPIVTSLEAERDVVPLFCPSLLGIPSIIDSEVHDEADRCDVSCSTRRQKNYLCKSSYQ